MPIRTCTATAKRSGQRCTMPAVRGGELCFVHDPDRREAARAAQSAGGRAALARPTTVPDVVLERERDAVHLAALTISRMLRGEIEPAVANAIATLCNMALKAMSQEEVDEKMRKLEEQLRPLKDLSPQQLEAIVGAPRAAAGEH